MGKKFDSDTPSYSEIKRLKKPNRRDVDIVLDPELARLIRDKERQIEQSKTVRVGKSLAESADTLQKELDDLWANSDGLVANFVFEDPGKKRFDDLVTAHPPTKDQTEEWKREGGEGNLSFNPDTFVPALIALTCVSPKLDLDEAVEICEEWGNGDVGLLFATAMLVCQEPAVAPLSPRSKTDTVATSSSDSN